MDYKRIFKNCTSVKEIDGKYYPLRMSEATIDYYRSVSEAFAVRAKCTVGISLEFETSAQEISFQYEVLSRARHFTIFDIYENNVLTETIRINNGSSKDKISFRRKTIGRGKVEICLPYGAEVCIYDLKLGDDFSPVATEKKKYLALGDSVTQGMDALHPSISYPALLGRFYDMDVLNQSVAGYYFDKKTIEENLPFNPDLVTIAFGTNDVNIIEDDEQMLQNAKEYIEKAAEVYKDSQIALITPIWRIDYDKSENFKRRYHLLCEELRTQATKHNFKFVDGLSLTPFTGDFYDDYLHPNDAGFLFYALNLIKALKN